ncbi:hypothetical protein ACHAXS_001938 [Conticribra weissflogii]
MWGSVLTTDTFHSNRYCPASRSSPTTPRRRPPSANARQDREIPNPRSIPADPRRCRQIPLNSCSAARSSLRGIGRWVASEIAGRFHGFLLRMFGGVCRWRWGRRVLLRFGLVLVVLPELLLWLALSFSLSLR